MAYTVEKRFSKTPEKFGTGMVEGVAAPEAANNSGAQTAFLPLLTLGIPVQRDHGAHGRSDDGSRHRAWTTHHDQSA